MQLMLFMKSYTTESMELNNMLEKYIHQNIADYLRLQYPNIIFFSDYAAGIKLTIGQARAQARLKSSRGIPDIFIAKPSTIKYGDTVNNYNGLFIELKSDNVKVFKKNGDVVSNPHIQEQYNILKELEILGYKAVFAVGFDQAKKTIDNYLNKLLT